ncbi:prepilin peptidase [Streptomyces sp. NPDC096205]|uniref:prepilin peptidase n=1 Tax=Streptomyces sp. NPDC096205 TaxID=3366081 RepID=UPI00382D1AA5
MNSTVLVIAAALWGAAAGALLPRAVYRFAAPSGEPWRGLCPGGHPVRGWLGRGWCGECARTTTEAAGEAGRAASDPSPEPLTPAATAQHGRPADEPAPAAPDLSAATAPQGSPTDVPAPGATDPSAATAPQGSPTDVPAPGDVEPPATVTRTSPSYGPKVLPLATVTALVCAALAAATGTRPELGVWLLLAPVGVLLAAVDFRVKRLPDPLTLPLAAAALALLGGAAAAPEHAGEWTSALFGSLALAAGYFVLFLINPGGMGFGDVKLALGVGAALGWYGWGTLMLGTFAGFLLGALYGGALVVARRANRKTAIPFGPFLIAGAFLGLLAGAYAA